MLIAPERRISSDVTTYTAAAALDRSWRFLETEVTLIWPRVSRLISVRSSGTLSTAPGSLPGAER